MSFQRVREVYSAVLGDEHGMALIVSLLAIAVLTVLALGVVQNSIASWRTASNDRTTKAALAIAESGAEFARESLRVNMKNDRRLNQLLSIAANHGTLVNATTLSAFGGSTGLFNGTTNAAFVRSTGFAGGTFQVFLTNDRVEPGFATQAASVQSNVDTNDQVMVTSFANGPGGSLAVVQEQLRLFDAFMAGRTVPGVLVLPGPSVNFKSFTSANRYVTGCDLATGCNGANPACYPTVAVTTNAAKRSVDNEICARANSTSQGGNAPGTLPYDSCGPQFEQGANFNCNDTTKPFVIPSTQNFLLPEHNPYDPISPNTPNPEGDPRLISVKYLNQLVAEVKAAADFRSLTDPGFTGGTTTNPKIIAIDGDQDFPNNWTGAGILLVTGIMNFKGGFTYHGIMLAIGKGVYIHGGNGNGDMMGATIIANTQQPTWIGNVAYVGVPTYQDDGGGASSAQYSSVDLAQNAAGIMPLQRVTFQQLR